MLLGDGRQMLYGWTDSTLSFSINKSQPSLVTKPWAWAVGVSVDGAGGRPPQAANQVRSKRTWVLLSGRNVSEALRKRLQLQIDPQMSRQVPSHQMSPSGGGSNSSRTSKVWNTAMYSARKAGICHKFTPEGCHSGPPPFFVCFSGIQHFRHSSLDLKCV